jgi:hypothetical protein
MLEGLDQNKIRLTGIPKNIIDGINDSIFYDEINFNKLPFFKIREKSQGEKITEEEQTIIFNSLNIFFNKIGLADYALELLEKEPHRLKWFVDTIFICLINNTAPFLSLKFQSINNTGITLVSELISLNQKRDEEIIETLNKESSELQNNFKYLLEQLRNEEDENKKIEILERLKNDQNYELLEGMNGNTFWDYDLKKTGRLYQISQEIKKIKDASIELSSINLLSEDLERQLYFFSQLINPDLIIQMIYDYIESCNIEEYTKKQILDYLLDNSDFYLDLFSKNKEKKSELEKLVGEIGGITTKEVSPLYRTIIQSDDFKPKLLEAVNLYNQLFEI